MLPDLVTILKSQLVRGCYSCKNWIRQTIVEEKIKLSKPSEIMWKSNH